MALDPEQMARAELSRAMLPTPDDVMTELSPMAALYYLEQMAWGVLKLWAAELSDTQSRGQAVDDDVATTLNQVATIVGEIDGTCARVGLISPDAVPPAP